MCTWVEVAEVEEKELKQGSRCHNKYGFLSGQWESWAAESARCVAERARGESLLHG